MCRCPFGRIGDGCEVDILRPCKQRPDGIPSCGFLNTKSCECARRCRKYYCHTMSSGQELCESGLFPPNRGCYMRDGVQSNEQFSLIPEANETGLKYFEGAAEDAKEINREEALLWDKWLNLPLSKCPDSCNRNGYCARLEKDDNKFCRCYRGYKGRSCEIEAPACLLDCSGRGKCIDHYCHCDPPFFSIGCSRSKVYPKKNSSRPSPVGFKIYMYELNTQLAYENAPFVGWLEHDPLYTAYQKFMARLLVSSVRTEDPSEADLFYIPSFTFSYSGKTASGIEHTELLLDHIKTAWPYWNRTGGKDHFIWAPADRGACSWREGLPTELIRIVHFGMYSTPTNHHLHFGHLGRTDVGCFHPLKDVATVPLEPYASHVLATIPNTTLDEKILAKKRLFFFAGGIQRNDDLSYAGTTRLLLDNLVKEWKDPEFSWNDDKVHDYWGRLGEAKFCLAPYGYGWGIRLPQAMLAGCVPVVVQEHVFQPYEDVLPFETFSLRLSNADLPKLREILRGVSAAQYKRLLAGVFQYREVFHWDDLWGSRAFDYTIASLRRRYLHLQGLLY